MSIMYEIPKLYPKQEEFLYSKTRYTLYGGAKGGGKSFIAREMAIILCLKYPGIHILLLRRTYPELEENHIKPLRIKLKSMSEEPIAKYSATKKEFTFPNGSFIKLAQCQNESETSKYQGHQYQIIFIDEATQFTYEEFITLSGCLRLDSTLMSQDPDYEEKWKDFKCRMYLTANPGGRNEVGRYGLHI